MKGLSPVLVALAVAGTLPACGANAQTVALFTKNNTNPFSQAIRVEAADGTLGWGEAPSAPTMTGDTQGGLIAAVRDHLAPVLVGEDAWMRPALMKRLRAVLHGNTGAHSAVEMALVGLAGQASGLPAPEPQPCAASGWLSRRWLPLGSRMAASRTP